MGGRLRATHRRIARRIPLRARKRIAAILPNWALGTYRDIRTDIYLVSFPKCGRTWLRVMIGRVLQLEFDLPADADLVELHRLAELDGRIPCIVATHDDAQWKTPDDVAVDEHRGRPVILLVRDPRDVVVSLYHQRRGRHGGYTGTMAEFLDERVGGFESLLRFYDAWADRLDLPGRILVVRYEDLHAGPDAELQRLLTFVGLGDVAPEHIADAVAFGSFEHMRQLEESETFASEKLRPGRRGDLDTYKKTRRGTVGSHRDELSAAQIERLDRMLAASGAGRFGYTVEPR